MYCECFTQGRYCDEKCECKNCHNLPENLAKIKEARKAIRTRNPQAFKAKVINTGPLRLFEQQSSRSKNHFEAKTNKIQDLVAKKQGSLNQATKKSNITAWHISGCKCKKSGCQKKYCECFQMGIACKPDRCVCVDCKNTEE